MAVHGEHHFNWNVMPDLRAAPQSPWSIILPETWDLWVQIHGHHSTRSEPLAPHQCLAQLRSSILWTGAIGPQLVSRLLIIIATTLFYHTLRKIFLQHFSPPCKASHDDFTKHPEINQWSSCFEKETEHLIKQNVLALVTYIHYSNTLAFNQTHVLPSLTIMEFLVDLVLGN